MSIGSVVSVVITFIVVLGLIGIAVQLLRKYTVGASMGRFSQHIDVIHRMPLGQRQGVAIVRVASRYFLVSVGEGGVRMLSELNASDVNIPVLDSQQHLAKTKRSFELPFRRPRTRNIDPDTQAQALASNRISYVAPLEDFRAVLSIAMRETVHS